MQNWSSFVVPCSGEYWLLRNSNSSYDKSEKNNSPSHYQLKRLSIVLQTEFWSETHTKFRTVPTRFSGRLLTPVKITFTWSTSQEYFIIKYLNLYSNIFVDLTFTRCSQVMGSMCVSQVIFERWNREMGELGTKFQTLCCLLWWWFFCKNIIKNSDIKRMSQKKLKGLRRVIIFLSILAEQHWPPLWYHGRHHNV